MSRRADLQHISPDPVVVRQFITMQEHVQTVGINNSYPNARHLIIEQAGQSVGRLVIDAGETDVRLVDIALLPQVHGLGFGRAILLAIQADAESKNLAISLSVEKSNTVARSLYRSVGFVVQSEDALFEHMHWAAPVTAISTQSTGLHDVAS